MHYRNARALFFVACALLYPLQAAATDSASASYRNTRSSVDSSGKRKTSASYRADGEGGAISAANGASASYSKRDGLDGIEFYPGRVTNVWGSTGAATGTVYLQWTSPGDDGYDASTAGSFVVRYSSIASKSPATSDANFDAATDVTPAPPAPSAGGTLVNMTVTGLTQGVTYYFAVKATERDGLRSVLSAGATVQTSGALGCAVTEPVGAGQLYATIQSAVNAIPNPLTGYSCVVIEDGATYAEQVTVRNFTMNGSTIAIFADPGTGLTPVVSPPAGTAAFVIANASVTIAGVDIVPTNAISYGIEVSSAYVSISSVNVQDTSMISAAGIAASSWTTVSYTSVTVGGTNASAIWLQGSTMTTVSYSSAAANSGSMYAIYFNGAASNTITHSYAANGNGTSAYLDSGSSFNTITQCSMPTISPTGTTLAIYGSSNTVTRSSISDTNGATWGTGIGLYSSYNTVSQSTVNNAGYYVVDVTGSWNVISKCTLVAISGPGANGVYFEANADYNTISLSTIASGGYSPSIALAIASSGTVVSQSYITSASTGVFIAGSTGTVLNSDVIVAVTAGGGLQLGGFVNDGGGLHLSGGNLNPVLSSSTVVGRAAGPGIFLDQGNSGLIVLSTNTVFGAQYGVFVATQTAGTQIWITSNTIVPAVTGANNTYGLYLNGLTSGATIENNAVAYRTPGSMSPFTSYALYAQSSSGLLIDHNRFDEPGMITGGAFVAVDALNVKNTAFKFNDVYSSGTNFTTAFLLDVTNASSGLILEDNVFFSSFGVTLTGSSATVAGDGSASNVVEDYNDYASSNSRLSFQSAAGDLQGLAAYQAASGAESHSISAKPLWFNVSAGVEDFHPLSTVGRWNQSAQNLSNVDGAQSATIDAGDPAEGAGLEPSPNGGLANQGSYGLTAQASESQPAYPGCAATRRVGAGQPYATISAGVGALPSSLPAGKSCVVIEDNATYAEQVTVQGFAVSASSIAIFAAPGVAPAVSPPAGSTAAFVIANSSVGVFGINVVPTNAMTYGILISSTYVTISSVNVQDAGGNISAAGVATSSWTTVSYTSVTVSGANAAGFWLPGSAMTSVSYSSAAASGASGYALWLNDASSNTFSAVAMNSTAGQGAYLDTNSDYNTIVRSTFTSVSNSAMSMFSASYNGISNSYIFSTSGYGLFVNWHSNDNTISQSTMAIASSLNALTVLTSSSNTFTQCSVTSPNGFGAHLQASDRNTISLSTITASGTALDLQSASVFNTIANSQIVSLANGYDAVKLETQSSGNTISGSTMTSNGAGYRGLYVTASASNTVLDSYIQGSTAVYVSGSTGTVIGGSVLVATNTAGSALQADMGSVNLALSSSVLTAPASGAAIYLGLDNAGLIVLSTNTLSGAMCGVYAAAQTAGTQIWITSNTIVPAVTGANNTYGLYFDGLTSGATIENNAIAYRTPGSMGSGTSYALYAQSASSLVIDHNRIDEPGMITGGSFVAADFFGTTYSSFTFNDVNSTGPALTNAFVFEATNASTHLSVRDNVFSSSFTAPGTSSGTMAVDGTSNGTFFADYNDYYSSNAALGFSWGGAGAQGLAAWRTASGKDAHSISAGPLWFNPSAGVEDFHPMSASGRWNQALQNLSNVDGAQSPTIDAGDPAEGAGLEPSPNGGVANQGSYGLTAQASESAQAPASPAIVSVGLSSATVSFVAPVPAANGYVVQASTVASFADVLYSSNTTAGATVLAPQGLDPNTTYYLRAGALWGATTIYSQTVLSTATLAPLVSGTTVYQIGVTSMVVNWIPLTLSPPSSTSAEGYTLQISTMASFVPLWTAPSSSTPNVLLSTLTAAGLTGDSTYYFRVGSLNWNGAVDYQSSVSTFMPIQLGVEMTTHTIALGAQNMNASVVISTSILLTNTGNVSETYSLRATTTTAGSPWMIGAAQGVDTYEMWTVVNSTQPGTADFLPADRLGDSYAPCGASAFTMGNQNCVQVPVGGTSLIWVKAATPLATSTTAPQSIQVTAQAAKDP